MTTPDARGTRPRRRRIVGGFWTQLALAFVVVGLVLSFAAKPYWVPSGSMEQTLQPGDRILVNRLAYFGEGPATSDIIVFDADATWDSDPPPALDPVRGALRWLGEVTGFGPSSPHTLVKRVIGIPGETVECCTDDGRVVVDGRALDETYVTNDFAFDPGVLDCTTTPRSQRCFDAVTVPDDFYLVLGDSRAHSADSAAGCRTRTARPDCWRWAVRGEVVGKAVGVIWPIGRWSGL